MFFCPAYCNRKAYWILVLSHPLIFQWRDTDGQDSVSLLPARLAHLKIDGLEADQVLLQFPWLWLCGGGNWITDGELFTSAAQPSLTMTSPEQNRGVTGMFSSGSMQYHTLLSRSFFLFSFFLTTCLSYIHPFMHFTNLCVINNLFPFKWVFICFKFKKCCSESQLVG